MVLKQADSSGAAFDPTDFSSLYGDDFPSMADHLGSHEGYFPDAVCDDEHLRKRRGKPILSAFEKLQALSPDLIFCTVLLPDFQGRALYSKRTLKDARKLAVGIITRSGSVGGVWKLERGRCGGFHLHFVVAADSDISELGHVKEVYDLEELADYFSKPADGKANKPEPTDLALYSVEELERQRLEAGEEWLNRERAPAERFKFWGARGLG